MSVSPLLLVIVVLVVVLAGAINGVAGFGFALIGTLVLASVIDPATAVVFMILPILAVNAALTRELTGRQLRTCGRRFHPLLIAAFIGTIIGMVALEFVPEAPLRIALGLVAIGFVVSAQETVRIPGVNRAKEGCFVETRSSMVGVGGVSGVLFGGTNVGVQLVAYLRSCDLPHSLFVGVVAMVFLGLNGIRVLLAGALGLYPELAIFVLSIVAIAPAVVGVAIGRRLRSRVTAAWRRAIVLGLLSIIGVRLILAGTGIV